MLCTDNLSECGGDIFPDIMQVLTIYNKNTGYIIAEQGKNNTCVCEVQMCMQLYNVHDKVHTRWQYRMLLSFIFSGCRLVNI